MLTWSSWLVGALHLLAPRACLLWGPWILVLRGRSHRSYDTELKQTKEVIRKKFESSEIIENFPKSKVSINVNDGVPLRLRLNTDLVRNNVAYSIILLLTRADD
ncbi:hypothetical protein CEXT_308711 [Caerostris extrusa]|uniref:Uncharacterized protein n=1 Tax=Caerostris extrusa TaxID=172846 RepID=A0AAV4RRB0_CAEEX|nr:hypothetical protein CEXT_308711 [Caerostris extrusa]